MRFKDGASERVQVDFPIGHKKRRAEGMPVLVEKFNSSVNAHFSKVQSAAIIDLFADSAKLDAMTVPDFVAAFVKP